MILFLAIVITLFSVKVVISVPNTAIPIAPPIFLTSAKIEEATPISEGGTDEAMRFVRCAIPEPMKRAMSESGQMISQAVERGSIQDKKKNEAAAPNVPQKITERGGNFASRNRPSTIADKGIQRPIGINSNPDCVASYPRNVCAKIGIAKTLPIIPRKTTKLFRSAALKVRFLKKEKSTIGSG